jgi:hypothetical protein
MPRKISFSQACALYVHRFTMEHVPSWATRAPSATGGTSEKFYAPQFTSDKEWYANTVFPDEPGYFGDGSHCNTSGATWPLGQWLDSPYRKD